jgi:hypothetical protein
MFASSIQVITDLQASAAPEDRPGHFYLGEAYRRRGKEGDKATGGEAVRAGGRAAGRAAAGLARARPGAARRRRACRAAAALHRYLELAPQADDLAFVTGYLAELETPK